MVGEFELRKLGRFPAGSSKWSIRIFVFEGYILCAISGFSVSLWCLFRVKFLTTETQRTQRLHREFLDSEQGAVEGAPDGTHES